MTVYEGGGWRCSGQISQLVNSYIKLFGISMLLPAGARSGLSGMALGWDREGALEATLAAVPRSSQPLPFFFLSSLSPTTPPLPTPHQLLISAIMATT